LAVQFEDAVLRGRGTAAEKKKNRYRAGQSRSEERSPHNSSNA